MRFDGLPSRSAYGISDVWAEASLFKGTGGYGSQNKTITAVEELLFAQEHIGNHDSNTPVSPARTSETIVVAIHCTA